MSNTLKNKHWLKIGIMILALCFCLSGICGTALADAIDRERFSILEASQQEALEAYEKIWNSFEKDMGTGEPVYPEEYGGEYIEDGLLYIWLLDAEANAEKYIDIAENSSVLRFKEAAYSLNYLESRCKAISAIASENNVTMYTADRKNNGILIEVEETAYTEFLSKLSSGNLKNQLDPEIDSDDTKQAISDLQDMYALSAVTVAVGEPAEAYSTTGTSVKGGMTISGANNQSQGSVGICGRYNNKDAILTCGHGQGRDTSIKLTSYVDTFGTRALAVYSVNERDPSLGEYSIFTISSGYSTTALVKTSSTASVTISGYYSSLPVGTAVRKYGSAYGYATGTVEQVNCTEWYQDKNKGIDYYASGLTLSIVRNSSYTVPIGPGDSGGPVFIYSNSSYLIHGTIVGGGAISSSTQNAHKMYSSPIYYAIYNGFSPCYG